MSQQVNIEGAAFANLVAALVSPHLRYVTGAVAPVDGGSGIGMGVTFDSPPTSA
jgi:3-oxoacyl-[acyl-carrier protein] reductase